MMNISGFTVYLSGRFQRRILGGVLTFSVLFLTSAAWSAGTASPQARKLWSEECSACHDAYPPRLLPGYSWKRIMDTLDHHFGTDASLDQPERGKITAFLVANRPTEMPLRITQQDWFRRIHGNFMGAAQKKGVHISNCSSCHRM